MHCQYFNISILKTQLLMFFFLFFSVGGEIRQFCKSYMSLKEWCFQHLSLSCSCKPSHRNPFNLLSPRRFSTWPGNGLRRIFFQPRDFTMKSWWLWILLSFQHYFVLVIDRNIIVSKARPWSFHQSIHSLRCQRLRFLTKSRESNFL